MRSAIVRIDESRVEVELIDLVKFRPEALGWHFRYPQPKEVIERRRQQAALFNEVIELKRKGLSNQEIARRVGKSCRTVLR